METATLNKNELVITRILDAPRDVVWKAWTDPEQCSRWFGPRNFTVPFCLMDLKVGGKIRYAMRSPEGMDFWGIGTYREVTRPERIVYTDCFSDKEGNVVPATYYGLSEGFPLEMLVTVTFEAYPSESGGKTRMTLTHAGIKDISDTDRNNMYQGWSESFDKLNEELRR